MPNRVDSSASPETSRVPADSISIIANPKSGAGSADVHRISELLLGHGIHASVISAERSGPVEAARRAVESGASILIAAGGDGTVSAVASVIAGTGATLGVLPTGTLNHFAKDMHIPLDLEEAIRVIAGRKVALVDVGEVNGNVFVNNSSLGIYPQFAMFKEEHRRRGRDRITAFFRALVAAMRHIRSSKVRLAAADLHIERRTPLVFIGNNEYLLEGPEAGTRRSLTGGRLFMVIVNAHSRFELFRLAFKALLGHARELREIDTFPVTDVWVHTRHRTARVAFDGEVVQLRTPLHYRVRPASLRVLVP